LGRRQPPASNPFSRGDGEFVLAQVGQKRDPGPKLPGECRLNACEGGTRMKQSSLRLALVVTLVTGITAAFIVPSASNAAAIITINDLGEGIIPAPTIVGQPPGVPGIQNVVAGNEIISFTYDDLIPAATTRTRLLFLIEPFTSLLSDEFSWSVTEGSSVETILFISDPNPITIPTPCVSNPDFFENSCDVVVETGANVFTVETSGTQYILMSDVSEVPEPGGLAVLTAGLVGFAFLHRRRNSPVHHRPYHDHAIQDRLRLARSLHCPRMAARRERC
jgi:hypothetical protein